ncbi:MAG TPA: hypothetical protein DEB16_01295 [Ruminococcaceae bacterium]|jgi:hypothetical protein|nr:hypothetical protein [Oscillospiraceae bacterium]HBG54790.1 hypothetical protein [Oscillospiraceae bacterium]HBQ46788.1 hypothetical protein [Oscillospiraceae bacterium]HBT90463.1 hypothetical protein [Oscillospiraceae bacterium]HCB91400.1 hypothetical protein [Oscillospiraceae bacterium]
MESVLKLFLRNDCKVEKTETDKQKLLSEIRDVSRRLAYNECWFQQECDRDLIDACIYQREELRARYRYLLSLAKQEGVNCAAFQI